MKYPEYINEELIKKTKELFNYIKQTQGTEEAFIFKKLSLAAAYGQMYVSKISYREFLANFESYLHDSQHRWRIKSLQEFGCDKPLVSHYWGIGDNPIGTAFWVSHEHIRKDNIEQLEDAIIEELKKTRVEDGIYTKYRDDYINILKEYETRRSK
jgi:hypothetical protein